MLQVLGAAAEFERSLILERSQAGQARYRRDFEAGKVGKTVHSRSGKNLPPHRPKKIFDREQVVMLRQQGLSLRKIAERLDLRLGTVTRTLQECSKS
jgi:DNA invertase Pin-like site-specific DNA recombinase